MSGRNDGSVCEERRGFRDKKLEPSAEQGKLVMSKCEKELV